MTGTVADHVGLAWKDRFTADQVFTVSVASGRPDRALVMASHDGGQMGLHACDLATGLLRPLAGDGEGIGYHWIDPPGDHVYLLPDRDGRELDHLHRIPYEGGPAVDLTPDLAPYTLRGVGFSADGSTVAFNPVNGDGFAVYVLDPVPGVPRLIFRDSWEAWGSLLSADGGLVATWSTARAHGVRKYTLLVFDTRTGEQVAELDDGRDASVTGIAFSPVPGDDRILACTSRTGFDRGVIWHPRTGTRTDLPAADGTGDIVPVCWSPDARSVLLCEVGGAQRLHRFDTSTGAGHPLDHPQGTYYHTISGGPDFAGPDTIVGLRNRAETPPDVLELDASTGRARRTVLEPPPAPRGYPWRSVTVRSADGTPVQAFVATPPGEGPFPTIIETHGGPHITMTESYEPAAAGWVDRGYAWISPNYRGSTGFGRDFTEKIWGRMGEYELQDVAAVQDWAIREGIARRDECIAYGASYGGYLTLLALGRQPDRWLAGIAVASEAYMVASFYECSDALRAAVTGWMRGTPEERPEAYAKSSPITYAADVVSPILAVQLENDTRTPPEQMRNYERRMRELGKPIRVDWIAGGHASFDMAMFIDLCERMYAFADRVVADHRAG